MSRVVYLHIGAPKTGTTYMQDRLMLNQAQLAEHGVTIPTKNRFIDADLFHFRAALDLLDQDWGGAPGHAVGVVGHDGQARAPGQRHRDHQPRGARAGQARRRRARDERPRGQRDPPRLLRPRPRAPAPGRVAGEHQAGSQVDLQAVPRQGRARPDLVPGGDGPAGRPRRAGARRCRPSACTSSPSRTTAARPATSCGSASAAPSASTRPGRRSTPSAPTGRWASPRPSSYAASTVASSCRCGAMRPTTR